MTNKDLWLQVGALMYSNAEYKREALIEQCQRGAERLDVTWDEVIGRSRKRRIVDVRRLICGYLRSKGCTLSVIGEIVGGRDHATVLHHANREKDLLQYDNEYQSMHLKFILS